MGQATVLGARQCCLHLWYLQLVHESCFWDYFHRCPLEWLLRCFSGSQWWSRRWDPPGAASIAQQGFEALPYLPAGWQESCVGDSNLSVNLSVSGDVMGKSSALRGKWLIYFGGKHRAFHKGCILRWSSLCLMPPSSRAASSPTALTPGCTWSRRNVMSLSANAQEAVKLLSSRRKVAHAWLTLTAWRLTSEF